jgi:hypothetical protein
MEQAFEQRIQREHERLAAEGKASDRAVAMLDEMAQAFYNDLRSRMESFFKEGGAVQPSRSHG